MKKHYLRLLSIVLCALFCSNAFSEKLAYGFHVDNLDELGEKYLCTLDVENTSSKTTINKIEDYDAGTPLSGVYVEKDYCLLSKVSNYAGLYKVDLKASPASFQTITAKIVDGKGSYVNIVAIAYDPIAKTMYGIAGKILYTLNLDDGTASKVADVSTAYIALAFSAKGELYGIDNAGNLYSINKGAGTAETTMTEIPGSGFYAKNNTSSLFFDFDTNKLYYHYTDADSWNCYLAEIDLENKTVLSKKQSTFGDQLTGLSFIQTVNTKPIDPLGARTAYGLNYSENGAKFVKFNANAANDGLTDVGDYAFTAAPQAGVNVKDVYYIIAKGKDDKYHLFKSTDVSAGTFEQVGTEIIEPVILDMAYDAYKDITYAIANNPEDENGSILYTVNLTTGALEGVAWNPSVPPTPRSCSHRYYNLTTLTSGQLYGITTENKLTKLVTASGQGKIAAAVNLKDVSTEYPQDLEFDLSTWTLYWSYRTTDSKSILATIDPTTGEIISKTEFKDNTPVIGLYFPEKEKEPTATWFGYCYANDNTLSDEYGDKIESLVTFDPANLASISLLPSRTNGIWCGAQGEDGLYSFDVKGGGLQDVKPASFSIIDVKTWQKTKLFDLASNFAMMSDMTYDFSSSMFYFISIEENAGEYSSSLYSLLITNNVPTWKKIKQLNKQYAGIACSLNGELYGLNMAGELCKINKITGNEEIYIAETGIIPDELLNASLEFDHNDETLYMSYTSKSIIQGETRTKANTYLAKIDLTDKTVTQKLFPGTDKVCALYIPFERDPNIPGKVTEFVVDPALYGTLRSELTWVNPTTTLGGDPLTTITSIQVIRNGELIHTITKAADLEPGVEVIYKDKTPINGFNNYIISVTNEVGTGVASSQLAFIGEDTPIAPLDIQLKVENGTTAILTWKAPNIGINTGFIDKSGLSYRIVRQPDNVEVEKATPNYMFYETIDALNYYYYEITATGAQGTSEVGRSNSAVIGTAMSVPYECDFMSEADLGLWTLDSQWAIGNLGLGEEYQGLIHAYELNKADCWAYSPAIQLSNEKNYKLTFDARSVGGDSWRESMKVYIGTDTTATAQTVQIIDIPEVGGGNQSEENPTGMETYNATFKVSSTGHHYLGIYCYSEDKYELQVTNIKLTEDNESSIENNSADGITVYSTDGKVYIEGEYSSATVYDQMGMARSVDATLNPGVYFVKIMNGNSAKTYKVLVK